MRSWTSALSPVALTSLCARMSLGFSRHPHWDAASLLTSRRGKAIVSAASAVWSTAGTLRGSAAFFGVGTRERPHCAGCQQQELRISSTIRRVPLAARCDCQVYRLPRALLRRGSSAHMFSMLGSGRGGGTGTVHTSSIGGNGSPPDSPHQQNDLATDWPSVLSPVANSNSGDDISGIGISSLAEIVKHAAQWLEIHGVVDPVPSASELLAKATGFRSPQEMLSKQRRQDKQEGTDSVQLSVTEWDDFRRLCVLRAVHHVPVQYLVGEWDFYGLSLEMKPPTLIPRPETEELVEIVLKWLRRDVMTAVATNHAAAAAAAADNSGGNCTGSSSDVGCESGMSFLDVGSGTGAIGLALLNELPSNVRCIAVDTQESAVRLSRRNAERTGLQARYTCFHAEVAKFAAWKTGNSTTPTTDKFKSTTFSSERVGRGGQETRGGDGFDGSFDFIVSNPPYIPRKDMETLPRDVADHEDSVALDGGEDGLDVVRDIVRLCPRLLRKGGTRQLWMEVDTSHPEAIQRWLGLAVGVGKGAGGSQECRAQGVTKFEWMRDMSQRPRFVRLTFAEDNTSER